MRIDRMVRAVPATTGVLILSAPVYASGEAGSPTLFTGDLGNILWSLLTFVAVLVVLGKFAWGPILRALKSREEFIRDSLEQARKDREEAKAQLEEYARKIEEARAEASAIVEEGRRDADAVQRKIAEDARKDADAMLSRAKREIEVATETAVKSLYTLGANLATNVASRVIRKELDAKEHERLIADSISEFQTAGGPERDLN